LFTTDDLGLSSRSADHEELDGISTNDDQKSMIVGPSAGSANLPKRSRQALRKHSVQFRRHDGASRSAPGLSSRRLELMTVELDEEPEPAWTLSFDGVMVGFGRLWLHDHGCRSLVAVELTSRAASVAVVLDSEPPARPAFELEEGVHAPDGLLVTRSALWLPCPGQPLRRVDPDARTAERVETPDDTAWFASNSHAVYGMSVGPHRVLHRLDERDRSLCSRPWDGFVQVGDASESHLWLVDRTAEAAVCLDARDLGEVRRIELDGGRVTHLFADGDDAVIVHNHDLEHGIVVGPGGIGNRSQVYRVTADGDLDLLGEIGVEHVIAREGDSLLVGRTVDNLDPDLSGHGSWDGDPLGCVDRFALTTGARTASVATVPGQVDRLLPAAADVWVTGFVRSRQAEVVHAVDRADGAVAAVDLGVLALEPDEAHWAAPEPVPPEEQLLAELPGRVRQELTQEWHRLDERTGLRVSAGPSIDARFTLDEVRVRPDPLRVDVLFGWADEPGTRFGFRFEQQQLDDGPYGGGLGNAADNIWLFVMEQTDTGIMTWGAREVLDGVTWVREREEG
jgi:hypothetical protein